MKSFKVWIAGLIGLTVIAGVFYFNKFAKEYFVNSSDILYKINLLKEEENKLNYHILYASLYLYYNNDLIATDVKRIKSNIKNLESNEFFKNHYKLSYERFLEYKKAFLKKEDLVFEFLRYNIPIKNSFMFLGNSIPYLSFNTEKSKKELLKIISSVFLAKTAIDDDFLKKINLKEVQKLLNEKNQYNIAFYRNLKIFLKYFPKYKIYLETILNYPTERYLNAALKSFLKTTKIDLRFFELLSLLMILFILSVTISLIVLIYKLEEKIKEAVFLAEYDQLTLLANRIKFNNDLTKIKKPGLIVFNIDKFKNINDFFGTKVGDDVLKFIANELVKFIEKQMPNAKVYRLGADDFGILFDQENCSKEKMIQTAREFIKYIESKIFMQDNTELRISMSAGIACEEPLLENADIAVKTIKKDVKEKVGVFEEELNLFIKDNIQKSNEIKKAIEKDWIIPYFQPIFDKQLNVFKYEVLCRVKFPKGEIRSIYPYLGILKENKMYHFITQKILSHSLRILKKYPHVSLSINLSIEDVINKQIKEYIFKHFVEYDIAKRVTFEILESDISDYEMLEEFVRMLKKYKIEFAIDDFGSGYSNFARVLKLDADYLKIDGSLIKNIDKDEHSKLIVETIVDFAKKSDMKTVAEFVHSKEVFEITKEIGIDYFQGFYLGEPQPEEKCKFFVKNK